MKFNKQKSQILYLGRNNWYWLGADCLESNFAEKNLDKKLNLSEQCALDTKLINGIWSYVRRNVTCSLMV